MTIEEAHERLESRVSNPATAAFHATYDDIIALRMVTAFARSADLVATMAQVAASHGFKPEHLDALVKTLAVHDSMLACGWLS